MEDSGTSPEGRKSRSPAIWVLLVGGLMLSVAVADIAMSMCFHNKQKDGAGTAPDPQSAQAAPAPAAQEQQADQVPDTEEAKKVEARQQLFRSLPDPQPPVALDKIEGIWWADDTANQKVFAFVERLNLSASPYTADLSTSNGTKLTVECISEFPAMNPSGSVFNNPNYHEGMCSVLPVVTWIRIATSAVITNPETREWAVTYRESDINPLQSDFRVTAICYPDGTCTTAEKAGTRAWEKIREKNRRGDN